MSYMKFTDSEVQAVYEELLELRDKALKLKTHNKDFVGGKCIAYATAIQILINNCSHIIEG